LDPALKGKTKFLVIGEPTRKSRVRGTESPFEPKSEAYAAELKQFVKDNNI